MLIDVYNMYTIYVYNINVYNFIYVYNIIVTVYMSIIQLFPAFMDFIRSSDCWCIAWYSASRMASGQRPKQKELGTQNVTEILKIHNIWLIYG